MNELPRMSLAHLPTPVEPLERLSRLLGGPHLLVKRDDQTGLAFGGNKTRKLELLLADAASHGAQTLVTAGAVQSNHCRQTAAAARRCGFACILVLAGQKPDQPSGNVLLDDLLGAEIVWTDRAQREQALNDAFELAKRQGMKPYLIPYGGSNPLGATAYALAMQEFLSQGIQADWIVVASSSGGTQAGMVTGARLFGYKGRILGISIDELASKLKSRVAALASGVSGLLGEPADITAEDVLVDDSYLGEGYGVMGEVEAEAIYTCARQEGLLLDPVYTARAAGGMIDLIRKGFFHKDQNVLFWHTGGGPALFAGQYQEYLRSKEY
jgi:D-cysteine desulfhydrase family pyridoxal phosphate-dependent enzyme